MIKAVLFDLDGTLLDTNELIYNSFDRTFKELLGITLKKEEIVSFFGIPLRTPFLQYFKEDEEDKIEGAINYYRNLNETIHDTMCFAFDGVKEMLEALKNKGIKIGIVTSKREDLAIRGMKIAGIYDYMDVIITPEKTTLHKPNGEPAEKACSLLGIRPEEALMVGDSQYDIMCGNKAGCKSVAVEYSIISLDKLKEAKPTYIIKQPIEILDLL